MTGGTTVAAIWKSAVALIVALVVIDIIGVIACICCGFSGRNCCNRSMA